MDIYKSNAVYTTAVLGRLKSFEQYHVIMK